MIDFLYDFINFFSKPDKKKIELLIWYFNKPKILSPIIFIKKKYDEHYYVNQVSKWLKQVFQDRITVDNHVVKLDNIVVFSIFISKKYFYKKANLKYIKMQMLNLMAGD
ncbi:MAG: hypothetical protein QXU98_12430 [Candidatus Parvarchaeota archaeon]